MKRVVCLFSCGAASAVATKLAIAQYGNQVPLVILNNYVAEEHPDNMRFLADCEKWFGMPIKITANEKYHASIYEVFKQVRFLKYRKGAPCTRLLKRELRDKDMLPGDCLVVGYTIEEQDRLDNFIDANSQYEVVAPLIEMGLTKADCLGMLTNANIELPAMYKLGYHNNNCRGCVKGGKGYWNKVRIDFPEYFEKMAVMQDILGPGSYFFAGKKLKDGTYGPRVSLRDLPPDAGHYPSEPEIQCGAACELTESAFYTGEGTL